MPSDRTLRALVPSLPPLTRRRALMLPLDLLDRILNLPWRELRALPPNRMRLRVGVQNRLLCNGIAFRTMALDLWMVLLARGHAALDSRIVDLGCGCGRFALPLRDLNLWGRGFRGQYLGVDIDPEMLAWCRRHFDARFSWHDARKPSATYRPRPDPDTSPELAAAPRLAVPVADASRDLVLANSLFSHLLEHDFIEYAAEAARMLRPGGWFYLTAFVLEHVRQGGRLGDRWTFGHQRGAARIESPRYPEAAVAYEIAWIRRTIRAAGFDRVRIARSPAQSLIWCRRGQGPPNPAPAPPSPPPTPPA